MAIEQIGSSKDGNIRHYMGMSGDIKPTNCGIGSTIYERDNARILIWTGSVWVIQDVSPTSTTYKYSSTASTNVNTIASAKQILSIFASNIRASSVFLKIFDKSSSPILGTDTPCLTIPISQYSNVFLTPNYPIKLTNGISFAITGSVSDMDGTSIGANEVKLIVNYK